MFSGRNARPAIHVVAGVIMQAGRLCITRRHREAHQGGKWEFPGGKLEPGETPLSGLIRELREELSIDVQEAEPLMEVRHVYPEVEVLLDIWRVLRYRGEPHGREGQEMRWAELRQLDPDDFPDADRPVLRRLLLPALYLISDVRRFGADIFATRLEQALDAGARLVQLREPWMDLASFGAYSRRLAALCHRYGAHLLINADPAWVRECEADGVHLNSARLMSIDERPVALDQWLAASCHDSAQLQKARDIGVDLAVLGPVQRTSSHPEAQPLGWDRFRSLCGSVAVPVYAIGGMQATDLPLASDSGAYGIATISAVWGANDPAAVIRRLHNGR